MIHRRVSSYDRHSGPNLVTTDTAADPAAAEIAEIRRTQAVRLTLPGRGLDPSPSMAKTPAKGRTGPSDEKYQRFAEQFVDMILDSRNPRLFSYLIHGGFQTVLTSKDLNSEELAYEVLSVLKEGNRLWEPEISDALLNEDQEKLVRYFKKTAKKNRLSQDALARILETGKPEVMRKSFKQLWKQLSSHRGPRPKIATQKYGDILKTADLLKPAIKKLLEMPETTRTIGEGLKYLQKDFPEACEFLLRHVNRLRQAPDDPQVQKRAFKRIEARARVVADAMAGSDYRLSFRTSLEYVGQARRDRDRKSR